MTQHHDHNSIELDLLALADGELDDAGRARVAQYLAQHPEASNQVASLLLLKQQVGQAMREQTPPVSDSLKASIEKLLVPEESTAAAAATAPALTLAQPMVHADRPRSVWTHWVPPALAAMVLFGVSLMIWQNRPVGPTASESIMARNPGPSLVTTSLDAPVAYAQLSEPRVQALGKRHNTCSKKLEALYRSQDFPNKLSEMPAAIAGCVGKRPRHSLDLSQMGYEFTRAGECHSTGETAVHMVYRAKGPDGDSVSLWVLPYKGQPEIREGLIYQGNVADSDIPIFFWRQDELVYYLVGNSFDRARVAAQSLVASR